MRFFGYRKYCLDNSFLIQTDGTARSIAHLFRLLMISEGITVATAEYVFANTMLSNY